jgi:VWA domain-containing protein
VRLEFLSPGGALLAFGVVLPFVALLLVRRRAGRVRDGLGLARLPRRGLLLALAALLVTGTLVGLAAAQPVLEWETTLRTRTDAEAFVVVDVSRSMLARRSAGSPTRLERATAAAIDLRAALPEVRFGVASLTDRTLPHLFPSADRDVFGATLTRSLGIEQPPPRSAFAALATSLEALATIRTHRYFSPTSRKRLLVVLTDGESQPISGARLASLFREPPVIEVLFVHLWHADERVYTEGAPEPQYEPDPSSRVVLDGVARSVSGNVFAEGQLGAAARRARELVGSGPTVVRGEQGRRIALAEYLAAAALAPLGLLLWRRDR